MEHGRATGRLRVKNDKRRLVKLLRDISATETQQQMALILYYINGLDNALEFVNKVSVNKAQGDKVE